MLSTYLSSLNIILNSLYCELYSKHIFSVIQYILMSRRKLDLKRVGYVKPLRLVSRYGCKGKDKNRV